MQAVVRFLRTTMLWIVLLPYALIFLGAASNQAVIYANGDRFPVLMNTEKVTYVLDDDGSGMLDEIHCLMTPQTHLNLMADIFDFGAAGIWSIGDLMLAAGSWLGTFVWFVWGSLVVMRLRENG